ncbi:hypothetical protein GCM10020331_032870 [Ectobacillus funiculus]
MEPREINTRPFFWGRVFFYFFMKELNDMAESIKITFPDGAVKEFPHGTTTEDIAASISPGLKKKRLWQES